MLNDSVLARSEVYPKNIRSNTWYVTVDLSWWSALVLKKKRLVASTASVKLLDFPHRVTFPP